MKTDYTTVTQDEPAPSAPVEAVTVVEGTIDEEYEKGRRVGAGVASGIVGCLIGGPFLGILCGYGAAYATTTQGFISDKARALGDWTMHIRGKKGDLLELTPGEACPTCHQVIMR